MLFYMHCPVEIMQQCTLNQRATVEMIVDKY